MTKLVCTSDLHGYLPKIPECDILLIAGDICPRMDHTVPFQEIWLRDNFRPWLCKVPAEHLVFIAGNHDFYFEYCRYNGMHNIFTPVDKMETNDHRIHYLEDNSTKIGDLVIYGTPWQRRFFDWAFNLDEPELDKVFDNIRNCDILLTHQPAWMCGDWSSYGEENTGSKKLLEKLLEIQPKVHVTGHIHSGVGLYRVGKTLSINASYVNEKYQPVNQLWEIEL